MSSSSSPPLFDSLAVSRRSLLVRAPRRGGENYILYILYRAGVRIRRPGLSPGLAPYICVTLDKTCPLCEEDHIHPPCSLF